MSLRIFFCALLWLGSVCGDDQHPSFKRMMGMNLKEAKGNPQVRLELKKFSRDYKKKIVFLKERDLRTIPKKIHFIWLGPRAFPESSVQNVISWQQLHPDWEIFFWTDSKDRPLPAPGVKKRLIQDFDFGPFAPLIAKSDNWGEKSDLMRIIILLKEGGLYSDHDITCVRSWTPFADSYDFVTACQKVRHLAALDKWVTPEISLILSRPNHPILKKMIKKILANWDRVSRQYAGPENVWQRVIHHTYMHFSSTTMRYNNAYNYRNIILPASYIYLYNVVSRKELKILEKAGYVYALHEGAGEWMRRRG
jgi:mannosyltransferase OCH1-like enzyme